MSTDHTPQPSDPTADAPDAAEDDSPADEHVMSLLSEHVPLSLIVDLSDPQGPKSEEILTEEGEPEDAWWGVAGDGSAAEDDEESADAE